MQRTKGIVFLTVCLLIYLIANSDFKGVGSFSKEELPFELSEVSSRVGVEHVHKRDHLHSSIQNVEPWLNGVGASLAIADVNNDGFQDIYLCNKHRSQKNVLYINNGNGQFVNRAEEFGVASVNYPDPCTRAIFFDYNNDGLKDLFLGTMQIPKLFKQLPSGQFVDVTEEAKISNLSIYAHGANVLDYDRDGDLDLLISAYLPQVDFYKPHTMKFMPDHTTEAKNGGPTVLYENNGDGTFRDVTSGSGLELNGWVFSVGVYDLNYDGWPDVWVANDFNRNTVLLNNKDKTFKNVSSSLSAELAFSGMNVDVEDIDHDKRPAVFISHVNEPGNKVVGNQLWKFFNQSKIDDQAEKRKVLSCGWAWGAKFVDLDNDGWQDLVVSNGFISADPKKDYWYYIDDIFASGGKFMSDVSNWFDMKGYTISGYQKSCVFLNNGKAFDDVTDRTVLKEFRLDGRAVGVIDYLNNGSLSLVMMNQSQKTLFLENKQRNKNNWVGFRLISRGGYPDVYGATAEVHLKDKIMTKQTYFNNGLMSQSDSRLHFGLGRERGIEKIVIRWPSGKHKELTGVEINRYHEVRED